MIKFGSILLAVRDMEKSKRFYTGLLERKILMDLGANLALDGVALQEFDMWLDFVQKKAEEVHFGGAECELVFETEDLDAFTARMDAWEEPVEKVHEVRTFPWGQRVVRFYDPDRHIIEMGETMEVVVCRFIVQGMSDEEVGKASMMPPEFIAMVRAGMEKG